MKSSAENHAVAEESSTSETRKREAISPLLKEIQGSFAIEGIHVSDERLREYAEEFASLKKSGMARDRILRALAKRPFRQA